MRAFTLQARCVACKQPHVHARTPARTRTQGSRSHTRMHRTHARARARTRARTGRTRRTHAVTHRMKGKPRASVAGKHSTKTGTIAVPVTLEIAARSAPALPMAAGSLVPADDLINSNVLSKQARDAIARTGCACAQVRVPLPPGQAGAQGGGAARSRRAQRGALSSARTGCTRKIAH